MAPGIEAATASPASTEFDELTTTVAPRPPRRRATASPIPLDEPVTIATLPESSPEVIRRASQKAGSPLEPEGGCVDSVGQPHRPVGAESSLVERAGPEDLGAGRKVDWLRGQVNHARHRPATEGQGARAE